MNSAVHNIAVELREMLYASEFRCMSGFLSAIAEASGAEGAGVCSVIGDALYPHRWVGTDWDKIEPEIAAEVVRPRDKHTGDIRMDSLGEWTAERKYLLLRRFWPPASWPQRSGEQFWLYVFDPRFVLAPTLCVSSQTTDQFGGLISAFIRWKSEIIAHHDELLVPPLKKPELVLGELEKLLVRPVLPQHFHEMLSRFTPEEKSPVEWAARIDKLLQISKRPDRCRCPAATTPGLGFSCPQTDNIDKILAILADLEIWRTEFWKTSKHPKVQRPDRDRLLKKGVEGLKKASEALHIQSDWRDETTGKPLDFSTGAKGLSGERLLLRHFCANGIAMALDRLQEKWEADRTHSSELEFPARLASLASTLLGDGRWTPDAIENLLQVVALFGHRVLRVPARLDLVRHLRQTLRGETALHTLKSRYRDHFFHTLEVCFLGFTVLRSEVTEGRSLAEVIAIRCHEEAKKHGMATGDLSDDDLLHKKDELFSQWWVAALIHDTAYGIDIFGGTLKLLDFFSISKEMREFSEGSRKAVAQMADPQRLKELALELEKDTSLKKGDHGVIAASSLNQALLRIGSETRSHFLPAVRAIAFHNTRFPKVDAGRDPIAALLILCDTVQEWGRSSLGFDHSPSVLLSRMMEASLTPPDEQFGPVKRYGLTLEPTGTNVGRYRWSKDNQFVIELDYGPASLKGCAAKFTWADFTYNLQRVDFRPWALDLRIRVSVPFPENTKSQFDHFGDFVEEQEVRFVERWFHTASLGKVEKAVSYQSVEKGGAHREVIEFNLMELSREYAEETPMMGGAASDFGRAIEKWSVFAREQADAQPVQSSPV